MGPLLFGVCKVWLGAHSVSPLPQTMAKVSTYMLELSALLAERSPVMWPGVHLILSDLEDAGVLLGKKGRKGAETQGGAGVQLQFLHLLVPLPHPHQKKQTEQIWGTSPRVPRSR